MSLDKSINWDLHTNAEYFTLNEQVFECKVVKVYDGDTIHVLFPYFNKMYKWNCRLTGIDTPELRTTNLLEKDFGYKVRDILSEKILNKVVKIKCGEFDKYGRLLCEVYEIENETEFKNSINNWLIENNYAFAYDGGTKKDWDEYLS
jgi:endonuclease YncB( thermonuclease family)